MARTPSSAKKTTAPKNSTADRILTRLRMLHSQASEDTKHDIETVIRDVSKLFSRSADTQTLVDAVREMTRQLRHQQSTAPEKKKRSAGPDAVMKQALFEVCMEPGMSIGVPLRSKVIKHTDPILKKAIKDHARQAIQAMTVVARHDADTGPLSTDPKTSTVAFIQELESKNDDTADAIRAIRATLLAFHRMKEDQSSAPTRYDMVDGCMALLLEPCKRTELAEAEDVAAYLERMLGGQ